MRSLLIGAAVLVLDQASKWLVLTRLTPGEGVEVIPGLFRLTLTRNAGAAFGLLPHRAGLLVAVAVLLLAGVLYHLWRSKGVRGPVAVGLGLALGGAGGNLVDRLRWGAVVDFLDFRVWPVFNLADVALVVGGALLVWDALRARPG